MKSYSIPVLHCCEVWPKLSTVTFQQLFIRFITIIFTIPGIEVVYSLNFHRAFCVLLQICRSGIRKIAEIGENLLTMKNKMLLEL